MLKKVANCVIAALIISSLLCVSVAAQKLAAPVVEFVATESVESENSGRVQPPADGKLKRDVGKLVSDTKAGKVKLSPSGPQSGTKRGLSKTTKIAIGVGIGVAILAIIAAHTRKHMFDGFNLAPLGK